MMQRKFRHGGSPAARRLAISLSLASFFAIPTFLHGQLAPGPITYLNRNCPGTGKPACYYCTDANGGPFASPGTNGAPVSGCSSGNPPNYSFGECDTKTPSVFDCTQTTLGCGDYKTCAAPNRKVGTCAGSNVVCQNN